MAQQLWRKRRTAERAAEWCLVYAMCAHPRGDQDVCQSYLNAANTLAAEALSMFPPDQVAAVKAYHDANPDHAEAVRDCVIAWAASQAADGR